jgi:hypothetical protein
MSTEARRYRAGETVEDYCRACKTDRMHTIIVTDSDARPLRVSCGYCHSEHNYRGGPRVQPAAINQPAVEHARALPTDTDRTRPSPAPRPGRSGADPFPIVSDREVAMSANNDLEFLLRRVIREETGITAVTPSERWRGGSLVLRPGTPGLQEKTWPIETFFHKVVMLRNRLRTLEQQVNAADMPDDAKVKIQSYITGCYGSLTSFNVLFAEEDDQFKGAGGD